MSKVEVRSECDKMENSNKGPKGECREMTEEETAVLVSVEVAFFGHRVLVWMIGFRVYPALCNEAERIQFLI